MLSYFFSNILCLNSWIRKDGQTGRQRNIYNPWEKFISDVHFLLNTILLVRVARIWIILGKQDSEQTNIYFEPNQI